MPFENELTPKSKSEVRSFSPEPSIYMERSGMGSRILAEKLLAPPECPLSVEDNQKAIDYEARICEHMVGESLTIEQLIRTRKCDTPTFFAEAFLQGQAQIAGLEGQLRQHKTAKDVYAWLAQSAHDGSVSTKDFRELSRQSRAYYKTEVEQALLHQTEPDNRLFDSMSIAIEPGKILLFADADEKARKYLMTQRSGLKLPLRGLDGAKRAFVDVYTKKINGMVLNDVGSLTNLIEQSRLIGDDATLDTAKEALPSGYYEAISSSDTRRRLFKRFDYIKNGIGYDKDGRASSVDAHIFNSTETNYQEPELAPVFSKEQQEQLKETIVDKETMHSLVSSILADAGMLSSENSSTWSPGRRHRAADELFQVVYQPIKDGFAVNGQDGVFMTPNVERSLYEVITVLAHELTHVNQSQADLMLGRELKIGVFKGRRVGMFREAGANLVQRQFQQELFGESKPVAFAYAKALQQLEAGGTIFDATKAFYDEKIQTSGTTGKAIVAKEAADRVLRLGSKGTNSQPMSYAEENIMNNELADAPLAVRQRATQITTLDLDDQLRLHTYGLLPEVNNADIDWTTIVMRKTQPLIEQALAT
jgi:hypothetical protein